MAEQQHCAACGAVATLKCGRCKSAFYCSAECRAKDWKAGHKEACKAPEVAAATTTTTKSPDAPTAPTSPPAKILHKASTHEDVINTIEREEEAVEQEDERSLVEELRERAAELHRQGQYEEAYDAFTEALKHAPQDARVLEARSGSALLTGRLDVATSDAERAVALADAAGASGLKARVRSLRAHLRRGSLGLALQRGEEVLRTDPTNSQVLTDVNAVKLNQRRLQAATEASKVGNWPEVMAMCSKVLQESPGSIEALTLKAEAMMRSGDVDEAFALTTRAMRDASDAAASPQALKLLNLRSLILFEQERLDQCSKHLREVLSADPDNAEAAKLFKRVKKIQRLKQEGDDAFGERKFAESEAKYGECLAELEPPSSAAGSKPTGLKTLRSRVHSNRAGALQALGKYEEAVKECDAAVELDEGFAKAYTRRAACLRALGGKERLERAVFDLEKAEQLNGGATRESRDNINQAKRELKMARRKDYYAILDLRTPGDQYTADDIKKAYKRAALKFHPDRHTNSTEEVKAEAENKFKDVSEAFEVLSDPEKRRLYDRGMSLEEIEQGGAGHAHHHHPFYGGGGGGGFPFGAAAGFGGFGGGADYYDDDDDPYQGFYGGRGGRGF